ncbi:uncharacterized protein LOC115627520 [Scaptodrosophila lebanonensis]|uniref:Uncharacterized protein LOC115627520 n=1 Tax=Drosophila lebanonensis TaxID=7225 RepID=A0A6J2TU29_DROLE|nr:uncharacterized protein LOC115627520 [Scaptodrosophila lebanonensis]
MEHHTYAKSGSKKWSVEEKRQLVMQRIAHDDLFSKHSPTNIDAWKKFKDLAKINDHSENALRKQWLGMVQRYRKLKAQIVISPMDDKSIADLNKEWEFFSLIHAYMNQKTNDLHSYALKEPNQANEQTNNLAIVGVYSCDQAELSPHMLGVLNDHSFGEKSERKDEGEESEDSMPQKDSVGNTKEGVKEEPVDEADQDVKDNAATTATNGETELLVCAPKRENFNHNPEPGDGAQRESVQRMQELDVVLERGNSPAEIVGEYMSPEQSCVEIDDDYEMGPVMIGEEVSKSNYNQFSRKVSAKRSLAFDHGANRPRVRPKKKKELTEKEKYYRHRRHYEQRMELRVATMCTVVGQALRELAPSANVDLLIAMGQDLGDSNSSSSTDDNTDSDSNA